MTINRLRGNLKKSEIDQAYPHQVEILAAVCLQNARTMRQFCRGKKLAPCRQYARRIGSDFLTWCFACAKDARAFQASFGGARLTPDQHRGQRLSLHYDRQDRVARG